MRGKTLLASLVVATLMNTSPSVLSQENDASLPKGTFEVYSDLLESAVTFSATNAGTRSGGSVTFGAEKEGSSSLITRVMGPSGDAFKRYAVSNEQFLRQFMQDFTSGRARQRGVQDINGQNKDFSYQQRQELRGNYDSMSFDEVKQKFEKFIEFSEGRPFSFIAKGYRQKIFNGKISGQNSTKMSGGYYAPINYTEYVPHFGLPEKYISDSHGTSKGWEINFNKVDTYGEFERMISWFKHELKNVGKLFEAPGHQRLVFPDASHLDGEAKEVWRGKVGEVLRGVQAYIVARGILGRTGIEKANHKSVLSDNAFRNITSGSGRGVIRIDTYGRFGEGTIGVELRAGTKDPIVQQFVEQALTARVAGEDLADLSKVSEWELDAGRGSYTAEELAERFGVSTEDARKFLEKSGVIKTSYQIALWKWENAPFVGRQKWAIKRATRTYIRSIARMANPTDALVRDALRRWVRVTQIDSKIRNYLMPQRLVNEFNKLHQFRSSGRVDVNKIDLGIEYSARFGNKYVGAFSEERLPDGQKAFLELVEDFTPHEREQAIKRFAETLGQEITGRRTRVEKVVSEGAHGHGESLAYEFRDRYNRQWRVEWDGVGRSYTEDGRIIPESLRGGHMEIVTPKFVPNGTDMLAVYEAMHKHGVSPSLQAGGGHINVDLAPFEGKPKQLARFLAAFHQHRGIIGFMFTNMNRNSVAEAVDVTSELQRKLKNFNGTELELKQLLYNEGYFNKRLGRKTRNVQIDMSAFFQDIIPAEHIHQDFDVKNPNEAWRQQFRVDPRIRKMEMRLFDAPMDASESALQVKLVRALLNKALNENGGLPGTVQDVNHERYVESPALADRHLKELCRSLGLEYSEYKFFMARALAQGKQTLTSRFYKSYDEKIRERGWRKITRGWGRALSRARTVSEGISSEGREWSGREIPEAREFRQRRLGVVRQEEQLRNHHEQSGGSGLHIRRELIISTKCRSVFR